MSELMEKAPPWADRGRGSLSYDGGRIATWHPWGAVTLKNRDQDVEQAGPQEEVAESESGGKGEYTDAPAMVPKENKDEDKPTNKPVEQPDVQIAEEEVQVITSLPKDRAKSPTAEPSFQTPPATRSTLESSSRYYDQSMTKRSRPPIGTSLNCRDHSFFEDILEILRFMVASSPHMGHLRGILVLMGSCQEAYSLGDLPRCAEA